MKHIVLYDIDSKIPNLALMKLSAYYKRQGYKVILSEEIRYKEAEKYFASTIFYTKTSQYKTAKLKSMYGGKINIGGSGISLKKRLLPDVEQCFPDYQLYNHQHYALGFLTRGCNKKCPFCLVPKKEGWLKKKGVFEDFVPDGQSNVLLLDDNLLAFPDVELLLNEIIYKYNNKECIHRYLRKPELLTNKMYKSYQECV